MITDRISLNVALKYLDQFEQNEGKVVDILFTYRSNVSSVIKTSPVFVDLDVIRAFIENYTPLTLFKDSDCSPLLLFDLRKFTVIKNDTNKNLVYCNGPDFITKSDNINLFSMESFNRDYEKDMIEIRDGFNDVFLHEYILIQLEYITCGYIELHTEISMKNLKKLYNKYKD